MTSLEATRALKMSRISDQVRSICGYISPTSGTQTVLDANGLALQLPPQAHVLAGSIVPLSLLVGGTNIQIGTATTAGGAIVTNLGAVVTPSMTTGANLGADAIPVPLGQTFVSCTSTGTFTAGKIRLVLKIVTPFN